MVIGTPSFHLSDYISSFFVYLDHNLADRVHKLHGGVVVAEFADSFYLAAVVSVHVYNVDNGFGQVEVLKFLAVQRVFLRI